MARHAVPYLCKFPADADEPHAPTGPDDLLAGLRLGSIALSFQKMVLLYWVFSFLKGDVAMPKRFASKVISVYATDCRYVRMTGMFWE